ncbi:MAG: PEP-CTERM sorting domain-containing protein [Verrucomicrobia bacterium]|nr:PEP-CTERM sorting domain-containing protein [Verrucomicrobiota bacterium]
MQTFQVGDNLELTGINLIVRRALEGAQFTLTLRDFGTSAPGNSLAPNTVNLAGNLASISHTVTAAQVVGNPSAGPVTGSDPFTTMTWTLATPVNLVPGNFYGIVFDGTNVTTGTPHIIVSYALGNPYAGGLGYYQDGNAANFLAGNNIFGEGNNLQADFGLSLIPEPSTYAMLTGLAVLGLVMLRRKRAC